MRNFRADAVAPSSLASRVPSPSPTGAGAGTSRRARRSRRWSARAIRRAPWSTRPARCTRGRACAWPRRNVVVAVAWLVRRACTGCTWPPSGWRRGRDRRRPSASPASWSATRPVIGIEIHCQLRTASKMFCGCSTAYADAAPNTPRLPGVPRPPRRRCPVINRRAVELVIATGLAIEAHDPRAHPVGAQELLLPGPAQGLPDQPVRDPARGPRPPRRSRRRTGRSACRSRGRTSRRTRRSWSTPTPRAAGPAARRPGRASLVDFNRSGAPLMEIVTEPDIRTAEQARRYAEELQLLLRAIGASDADMERGQMRVEANVSLRPRGTEAFGTRVEVKNMNSFRAVERAIDVRDRAPGRRPSTPASRCRWRPAAGTTARQATYRMRSKETSEDYRYFPDPDLPPLHVEPAWIDRVRAALPELPAARRARYEALGITAYDAAVIVADPGMTVAFEAISAAAGSSVPAKEVSNFVTGVARARREGVGAQRRRDGRRRRRRPGSRSCWRRSPAGPSRARSGATCWSGTSRTGTPAAGAARGRRARARSRTTRRCWRTSTPSSPPTRGPSRTTGPGKPVAGFFVGQVMKATGGAADAARVTTLVRERLDAEELRTMGIVSLGLIVAGRRADRRGRRARPRAVPALHGPQGAGRERRALRGVARRGAAGQQDGRVGRDGDAPAPGAGRRRRS